MAAKQRQNPSNPEQKQHTSADPVLPILQASRQFAQQPNAEVFQSELAEIPASGTTEITVHDMLTSELQAARLLNVGMPTDLNQFIALLEVRIQEITGTRKNVILILDEDSGTYTCLNDELNAGFATAPRELTWISDTYLQDLLGSQHVIHSFLHQDGQIFGIVAIADKLDKTPFGLRDEIVLEQLTHYLSVQVNHFLMLKRSMVLPTIQRILLKLSNQLLSAVDSQAILEGTLLSLYEELPLSAGQYIALNRKTGTGVIRHQMEQGRFTPAEELPEIEHFSSLLSLFQSQVWKHSYIYLKGEMLGDKSFSDIFGLPDIVSVLLLPMLDAQKQIDGALVLFQQNEAAPLSKDALTALEQVSELVMSACSRAHVLEKALEIATTDELTGAVNRRGFYSRFDAEVDRARRNLTPMCLAMIDVDHFKMVNDTYGHLAGDQILRELAHQIRKNIRKSDLLCRFGGEEFALLLPETTMKSAVDLLERLRRKIEKLPIQTPAGPVKITFSTGVDQVETTQGFSKESMQIISESLARADEALYEAKQLGRNRVIVVDAGTAD